MRFWDDVEDSKKRNTHMTVWLPIRSIYSDWLVGSTLLPILRIVFPVKILSMVLWTDLSYQPFPTHSV